MQTFCIAQSAPRCCQRVSRLASPYASLRIPDGWFLRAASWTRLFFWLSTTWFSRRVSFYFVGAKTSIPMTCLLFRWPGTFHRNCAISWRGTPLYRKGNVHVDLSGQGLLDAVERLFRDLHPLRTNKQRRKSFPSFCVAVLEVQVPEE